MRFKYSVRVCLLLVIGLVSHAAAQETKLKWFGHAAFSITTPKGKVLLIDPWIRNPSNPDVKDQKDPLASLTKVVTSFSSLHGMMIIPMHYGTFPGLLPNADGFAAELKKLKIGFYEMKPGETIAFRGKRLMDQ